MEGAMEEGGAEEEALEMEIKAEENSAGARTEVMEVEGELEAG